jgi:hypothetical protein
MFRKTVVGMLAIAAGVGAALLVKTLNDSKKEKESSEDYDDDEEVHFIKISDEDDQEEDKGDIQKFEDKPKFDASGKSAEVQEVCGVYPYLNPDFAEELLAKNEEFKKDYEDDTLINVTHKVNFPDADSRKSFDSIMDAAGYVDVQLSDTEMTSTKKFYTEEGAIISDILNVANQTAALHGTYEGYDIFKA